MGGRIGDFQQTSKFALNLHRRARHLVPETQVEHHVRTPTPVILYIEAKDGLAKAPLTH